MAKNKTVGISEVLKEQAKERFAASPDIVGAEIQPETEAGTVTVESGNKSGKTRKNFYIESHLAKLLRKMAYEKEVDQTKIVNEALELFFKSNGYSE